MKIGIVGCGSVSAEHIKPLQKISSCKIVALCDVDKMKAKKTARQFSIADVYDNFSKLLDEKNPDVVHILTPPDTHKDLSIQAMEAGCHVLVEKPMAMNMKEAEDMIRVSKRCDVNIGVCHNFLFESAVIEARELFTKGALGKVTSIEIFWRIDRDGPASRYQTTQWIHDLHGGIFHEIAPHPVYLQMGFLNDLKVISACSGINKNGLLTKHDELRVLSEADSGLASLTISVNANPRQVFMRIYGTKMTLHIDLVSNLILKLRPIGPKKVSTTFINLDLSIQLFLKTILNAIRKICGRHTSGHFTFINKFYENITKGKSPPVTGKEGKIVVSVLDQIWEKLY